MHFQMQTDPGVKPWFCLINSGSMLMHMTIVLWGFIAQEHQRQERAKNQEKKEQFLPVGGGTLQEN